MVKSTNGNMGPESYHIKEFLKWLSANNYSTTEYFKGEPGSGVVCGRRTIDDDVLLKRYLSRED